jgi:hypothetical protein
VLPNCRYLLSRSTTKRVKHSRGSKADSNRWQQNITSRLPALQSLNGLHF